MKHAEIFVISNFYPGKISATFGIFVKNQVEALRARGLDIDVAAVKDPRIGKGFLIKKYLMLLLAVFWRFLLKGRRYKVVHAHYIFPCGFLGLAFKRWFGTRLIVTAHGGDIDKMAKINGWIRKMTGKVLNEADCVIVVGEGLKQDIVDQFGVAERKIQVINMGVNRDVFAPLGKSVARKKVSAPEGRPILLFVGNIQKQKGLDELVPAFEGVKKSFPDAELHLIGSPKSYQYEADLKKQFKDREIRDVHFHGGRPQAETAVWMNAADVLVLPSHIEGFGLVALEAMSCHTPVVGSDVGGLAHLLSGDCGVP
ncbi:MAG TPA: glycosyltransferase, partial [Bacillales bacterium]